MVSESVGGRDIGSGLRLPWSPVIDPRHAFRYAARSSALVYILKTTNGIYVKKVTTGVVR
jgi:hypothetical protein